MSAFVSKNSRECCASRLEGRPQSVVQQPVKRIQMSRRIVDMEDVGIFRTPEKTNPAFHSEGGAVTERDLFFFSLG